MTARDHALWELDSKRLPGWPSKLLRAGGSVPADARDLALSEQLTVGVTKNLLLLQHLTAHHSGRNLKSIDPLVQKILAIALYQLRFLTRIPASAAVDEAVEQARRFGRAKAAGFVNAVLRNATRAPDPTVPPDVLLSHPKDLFKRLQGLLGPEDAVRFCEHDQRDPPTIVRVGLDCVAQIRDLFADVALTPHEEPNLFVIENAKRSHLAALAARGLAQVQDPTAAAVVPRMGLHAGQVVLDRCAGRGTKTLQMREAVGASGEVHAIDVAGHRIESLRVLVAARGLCNVHPHCAARLGELAGRLPERFDGVLIDAPCSNSGVLARRPEARYHQSAGAIKSLAKLQDDILNDTAPATAAGGVLVYSTCSVWTEENEHRVQQFRAARRDFRLLEERFTLPSFSPEPTRYRDGGYYAVLRRI